MDSLALTSVPGLIGHPSRGLRAESHWPDLGHTTQLAALTQGVRLPLAQPRSPTHERARGGPAPRPHRPGWEGFFPKENHSPLPEEGKADAGQARSSEPRGLKTSISLSPSQSHKEPRDYVTQSTSVLCSCRVRAL